MNILLITLEILTTLAFLFVSALCVIDSVHFFQLNSYRADTHFSWIRHNISRFLPHALISVLLWICVCLPMNVFVKLGAFLALFLLAIIPSKSKKAKKPLVYTARVKRMLVTTALLFLILTALPVGFFFVRGTHQSYALLTFSICFFLSPLCVLLSNLINKPIEKAICDHYTKDAMKILDSMPNLIKIGITGSFGKTSVKFYLEELLKTKFNVLMTPESFNTPMGVVKTIRGSLRATHEVFICEMGAKWVGDIKELCDIVHPNHGIITSIGPQHLESFGSLSNVKKTKFEMAQGISREGILLINGDDENIADFWGKNPAVRYGFNDSNDYVAKTIKTDTSGTEFCVTVKKTGESETFFTKLIGTHNVLNITGAIAMAHQMGINLPELKGAVRRLKCVPHRLELSDRGDLAIIDDAYNSNPTGTKAALKTLSLFEGEKILVTPGMVELGPKQDELNREFGQNAAEVCDYVILVGKKQAKPIKQGLLDENFDENKIFVALTFDEAISHAYSLNSKGKKKIILLENDLPDNY